MAADDRIEAVLDAAKRHGEEGEPDMEVGDLQIVLRAAWAMLAPSARARLLAHARETIGEDRFAGGE